MATVPVTLKKVSTQDKNLAQVQRNSEDAVNSLNVQIADLPDPTTGFASLYLINRNTVPNKNPNGVVLFAVTGSLFGIFPSGAVEKLGG
jgi:hypothetical protein